MPRGKKSLREAIKGELLIQINDIWRKAESCQEFQKGDTIQGRIHCEAVERNLGLLIPDEKKESDLTQAELIVLSAAACLHDIGKIESTAAAGRHSDHGQRSKEIIAENYVQLGLDRAQAVAVGHIVGVHATGGLDDLPREPLLIGTDEVRVIPLAAVFRLADMLDTTFHRAPELAAKVNFPDGRIPPKWQARQSISGWSLDESGRIVLQAIPNADELTAAHVLHEMMREDLAAIAPHLRLNGYPSELAPLAVDDALFKKTLRQQAASARPFPGMAYYEGSQAGLFKGREEEVGKLVSNTTGSPISLLIGESGAGKTSLIHAGLFPRMEAMRWRCVYTRPLTDPQENIKQLVWRTLLEGPVSAEAPLWEVMKQAAEKCRPHPLLIAIDQFEDVLSCPQELLYALLLDLMAVQTGTVIPNVRVLISFREDSLVKLSTRLLKRITGSARQFPSVELERLTRDGASQAIRAGLENAGMGLDPREETGQKSLLDTILDDIQKTDDRLYPPYVQMVAETLCAKAGGKHPIITRELYLEEAKGADNIISHYLLHRLEEFGADRPKAERVLICLTSSAGKRAQRTVGDLSSEAGMETDALNRILAKMVDLRIARALDEGQFEIIHDHLGAIVNAELINEDERTAKFLREQLKSFQHLYKVHEAPITAPTFLASLYRNRRRVIIDEEEQALLLCSYLRSTAQDPDGPTIGVGWYWLRGIPHQRFLDLAMELMTHDEEEVAFPAAAVFVDMADDGDHDRIIRMLGDQNAAVRSAGMTALTKIATDADRGRILEMLKDKDSYIRRGAIKGLAKVVRPDDHGRVVVMIQDDDLDVEKAAMACLAKIATPDDLPRILGRMMSNLSEIREAAVQTLAKVAVPEDRDRIFEFLRGRNNVYALEAEATALAQIATHDDLARILEMLRRSGSRFESNLERALARVARREDLGRILDSAKTSGKGCRAAAIAVLAKLATHDDLGLVLEMIRSGKNRSSSQDLREVLSNIVTADDRKHVEEMLSDEKRPVKLAAMSAFAKLATRDDFGKIIELLRTQITLRNNPLEGAFLRLAAPEDEERIREMLKEKDAHMRRPALRALVKVRGRGALGRVVEMLADENRSVQMAAVDALVEHATEEDAEQLLDKMADGVRGWDSVARIHYRALCLLDSKFYCPFVRAELSSED